MTYDTAKYQTQSKVNGMGLNKLVSALPQHLVIHLKHHVCLAANRLPLQTRHGGTDLNHYLVNLGIHDRGREGERIHPREALWSRGKSDILNIKFFEHTAKFERVRKAYMRTNDGHDAR